MIFMISTGRKDDGGGYSCYTVSLEDQLKVTLHKHSISVRQGQLTVVLHYRV